MKSKHKASHGGRCSYVCPECGNRDRAKMTLGQRQAYAECECGFVWDAETGKGFNKRVSKPVAIDMEKLGN